MTGDLALAVLSREEERDLSARRFLDLADAFELPSAADGRRRNVLFLADTSHPANVVQDHIGAFQAHSRHELRVINPIHEPIPLNVAWRELDAILVHYSIYVLGEYFLPPSYAHFVRRFPGPKLQIIQDEYRHINRMMARQAALGLSVVFSSLARDTLAQVYSDQAVAGIRYFSCLPGYVPDHFHTLPPLPIARRPHDIVYRGRDLPFWLGRAGQEKRRIGEQAHRMATAYGLKVDIDWTEESRIYGDAWMAFLMSGRATLGVEGGSSIFDFDGSVERRVKRYLAKHQRANFEEVFENVLAQFEGNVVHRTVTPKLLEAIAAKTALILYPGAYRGVLEPDRHYIPLEPDGSNSSIVVAKLRDAPYLQELVDRAHREVLGRRELSTDFYVEAIDAVVASLCASSQAQARDKLDWEEGIPVSLAEEARKRPRKNRFIAMLRRAAFEVWIRLPARVRNIIRGGARAVRTLLSGREQA